MLLDQCDWYAYQKRKFGHTHTHRLIHTEREHMWKWRWRSGWGSRSQGTPKIVIKYYPVTKKNIKASFPFQPSEGTTEPTLLIPQFQMSRLQMWHKQFLLLMPSSFWYFFYGIFREFMGFPHSSLGKESPCDAGDRGSVPGSGRSPGERNGNPLQYSCLENPMDRRAWWATIHEVAKSRTWHSN